MRKICFDFGGSMTDMVMLENRKILENKSFESNDLTPDDLGDYLKNKKFDQVFITGGNLKKIPDEILGYKIKKINEIQAIGRGGIFLYENSYARWKKKEKILIASLGTGCCFVVAEKNNFQHLGGTAVGGGTIMGLGKAILKDSSIKKLYPLALKGDQQTIDLSVKDIVGQGIGLLPEWTVASHFGKYAQDKKNVSDSDLARGIFSLCSGVIASSLIFAARSVNTKNIVLGGRLAGFDLVSNHIKKVTEIFGIKILTVKKPELMVALGAGIKED